ncbi:isocitrate/isopropylmalate dehydrogenase [Sagittula marina]|uniref:Isocitrate/isopropylmalate dehydrogenase n=1 Tax=Sagittula marina TaxID=943940 RepID=A0A7W6DPP7_9RHOB|nr:hypothetical protein [Sagittula marina]MBB3985421.1 isocitrate/isopropylmalate dehydrogenase [Sagittula marina]
MKTHELALLPSDGIGVDVFDAALPLPIPQSKREAAGWIRTRQSRSTATGTDRTKAPPNATFAPSTARRMKE